MARALTSTELAHLRSERQRSRLYLAIHKPVAVYSCRVNQAAFTDPVVEVTYDSASGTLAEVLADMTVWVGTTAGARDVGITRVRKAPTASVLYVPPGEIAWEDDLYLTVVDEFRLWPRVPQAIYNDVLMDWDVVYSDQHESCLPVPVLGPHAVAWLADGLVDVAFDASESWVPGSTISAYSWNAPGSDSIDDDTSATPLITYITAGTYRVSCTVTAANGKTTTGYRRVFVFDAEHPPVSEFALRICRGDYDGGGWSASVEMYDQCAIDELVEGALVVLFAQDWYGDNPISIGPIPGRENVITWGWIENEGLTIDSESGQARFSAQGPAWWMQQCHTAALNLSKVDESPTRWTEIQDLVIDHWVWHLITWRSTVALLMDVLPSGDIRYSAGFEAESGSLWDKVREVCRNRMATIVPACDRYGRLIVEIDPQLLPVANRTAVPVVQALGDGDWR
ncbi:MAG TPA: hypothetical protein VFF78_03900, partial [Anaerolineaceae bacterium]|nr:hypothetical protein [Anaerolineaceae bacterium]